MTGRPAIIVHGGAGDWPRTLHRRALKGVSHAALTGFDLLTENGSALDAVEEAVVQLEDNPLFNAGTGSALNLLGEVENDAAVMDGEKLRGGAVALLKGIKNPVKVARMVMERTDHVLLAGPFARRFALMNKLPAANLKTMNRIRSWRLARQELLRKGHLWWSEPHQNLMRLVDGLNSDTVGALAVDKQGHVAAADSTGGMQLKLPGRIGDSPLLGAGIYADSNGATASTGIGEQAMRLSTAKTACMMMASKSANDVALRVIRMSGSRFGVGTGVITLAKNGAYGVSHNTKNLCWFAISGGKSKKGMVGNRISTK